MAYVGGAIESPWRVYIENLIFNVSKGVLSSTIANLCGVVDPPIKVIRKATAMHSICSAIVSCSDENQMNDMIRTLNSVPTLYLAHILGHGTSSLNAKQAYIPGARLLTRAPPAVPPKLGEHTVIPPAAPRAFPPTPSPNSFFEAPPFKQPPHAFIPEPPASIYPPPPAALFKQPTQPAAPPPDHLRNTGISSKTAELASAFLLLLIHSYI